MLNKIALYSLSGEAVEWFECELRATPDFTSDAPISLSRHHLVLIDRSSSMAHCLDRVKHAVIKHLTLDEYRDAPQKISVISYAGEGDMTLHFERVDIREVMREGSPHLESILTMTSGEGSRLTEALERAMTALCDDELSLISIHTDGCVEERETLGERRYLLELIEALRRPRVSLNTIAHSEESDLSFLNTLTRSVGVCLVSNELRQVYDALNKASESLLDSSPRSMIINAAHDVDWVLFSAESPRVVTGRSQAQVEHFSPVDHPRLHLFRRLTESEYEMHPSAPLIASTPLGQETLVALARSSVSIGRLNRAKYCLFTAGHQQLLESHARALTPEEIERLSIGLERALFEARWERQSLNDSRVPAPNLAPVMEILALLNQHKEHVKVVRSHLDRCYEKIGLKRILGQRDERGVIRRSSLSLRPKKSTDELRLDGLEVNRSSATAYIRLIEKVNLVGEEGEVIEEIEGVDVDELNRFRSYAIISDGRLNLSSIQLKICSKRLFRELKQLIKIERGYDPTSTYEINLTGRPIVDIRAPKVHLTGLFETLARGRLLKSLCASMLKGRSELYTDAQLEALKRHELSQNLNTNFQTTLAFVDPDSKLLEEGVITRVRHKIELSDGALIGLHRCPSANAFIRSTYTVSVEGQEIETPRAHQLIGASISPRTHLRASAYRALLKPLMDDVFNIEINGRFEETLTALAVPAEVIAESLSAIREGLSGDHRCFDALYALERALDHAIESLYKAHLAPLILYVGSTGLVPDHFEAVTYTAAHINQIYPQLRLSKNKDQASYIDLGGEALLCIYAEETRCS